MASLTPVLAPTLPAAPKGWRATLARIGAFLEALDGDDFAASEIRIRRLEQRVARLEATAAQKEG